MKVKTKVIALLVILVLAGGIFYFPLQKINAMPGFKDQYNEVDSGLALEISNYGHAQVFQSSVDKIGSIDVYLRDRESDKVITLEIRDEKTGKKLWSGGHKMITSENGWETFSLPEEIQVTKNGQCGIYLDAVGTKTKWAISNKDAYLKGFSKKKGVPDNNDDFLFIERGSLNNNDTPETLGSNIKPPTLEIIEKNDKKIDASEKNIELLSKDSLEATGTAPANQKIIISIGDNEYTSNTDTEGRWVFNFDPSTIKEGEYNISAQAQNPEGKSSEKIFFFKINKLAEEKKETKTENLSFMQLLMGPYFIYLMSGIALALLILALVLYVLIRRDRSRKNSEPIPEQNTDNTDNKDINQNQY